MLSETFQQWKRESIRDRVISDVYENLTELFYKTIFEKDLDDFADSIGERVRDRVWSSIPSEELSIGQTRSLQLYWGLRDNPFSGDKHESTSSNRSSEQEKE